MTTEQKTEYKFKVNVEYEVWAEDAMKAAQNAGYKGLIRNVEVVNANQSRAVAPE